MIDPRDSNVVYVAAPGPLWKGGGERGLYKTTDGGKTWSQSLIKVDDYTGCTDVVMDPKNPDVLLAATHQRQRALFRHDPRRPRQRPVAHHRRRQDLDQGAGGIPSGGDLGRIGLNYAPSNPNIIYAQVEAPDGRGGLYPLHRRRRHLGAPQPRRFAGPVLRQGSWWIPPTPIASTS